MEKPANKTKHQKKAKKAPLEMAHKIKPPSISRGKELITSLKSKRDLFILKEILSSPKGML